MANCNYCTLNNDCPGLSACVHLGAKVITLSPKRDPGVFIESPFEDDWLAIERFILDTTDPEHPDR